MYLGVISQSDWIIRQIWPMCISCSALCCPLLCPCLFERFKHLAVKSVYVVYVFIVHTWGKWRVCMWTWRASIVCLEWNRKLSSCVRALKQMSMQSICLFIIRMSLPTSSSCTSDRSLCCLSISFSFWSYLQLEIRSVERGICPIASPQQPNCSYSKGYIAHFSLCMH